MKNKKKNVFIILLLIIVVLPILLSFIKCDNGNSEMDPSTTIQAELKSPKRLNRARAYTGTAVPNTGYIENVYFNTNMSVSETENIIINFCENNLVIDEFEQYTYFILVNAENTTILNLTYFPQQELIILGLNTVINESLTNIIAFSNKDLSEDGITISKGWSLNEIAINDNVIDDFEDGGLIIGNLNNELTSIISVTPFIQIDNRSGLQIIFEEIGSGLSGASSFFVSLFNSIVPVFWVNNQPTIITILVLAGVVITIGFWGIDKFLKLFKIGLGGKK